MLGKAVIPSPNGTFGFMTALGLGLAGVYKMYPGGAQRHRHIFGEGQVNLHFVGQVKFAL